MPKKNQVGSITASRKKKLPEYRTLRLNTKIKADDILKISSMRTLWRETWQFLWIHRVKMAIFVLIYTITYMVLVRGINEFTLNADEIKLELEDVLSGNFGAIITFVVLYTSLLSSITTSSDDITNFYQSSILIIFSLSFIWLIRKLHLRDSSATVKDAFYQGMRPLIPFLIVIIVMALELIPAGVSSLIFVTAQSASVVSTEFESLTFSVLAVLGFVLTVYLLVGSIFAPYIVTLPNMKPMAALRSSMRLLRIHRWIVLRKILLFFITLLVLGFFLVLPFIIWLPKYAEIAFFVMGCGSFAVMHTFMYKLYRSML